MYLVIAIGFLVLAPVILVKSLGYMARKHGVTRLMRQEGIVLTENGIEFPVIIPPIFLKKIKIQYSDIESVELANWWQTLKRPSRFGTWVIWNRYGCWRLRDRVVVKIKRPRFVQSWAFTPTNPAEIVEKLRVQIEHNRLPPLGDFILRDT